MVQRALTEIKARIDARSADSRQAYEALMQQQLQNKPERFSLPCSNLAHGVAACNQSEKTDLTQSSIANIAIISAYNDMLSAHQPLEHFPNVIKAAAKAAGGSAQFAGGVPAMCDGITQGMPGMELSLFSRDIIAMSTIIALSHQMFDSVICLGVCDKIIPGLLIGALRFGHLPCMMQPAGPMPFGLPNIEKKRIREEHAKGNVGEDALLESEMQAYHSAGTCTFYGTANSNQILMEVMGLHLPGTSFLAPDSDLRHASIIATTQACLTASPQQHYLPLWQVITSESIIHAMVALCASGGSTNHSLHLIAIARAAGLHITWEDLDAVSAITPLLCRIYPNGEADINQFHAAGGVPLLLRELLDAGLIFPDALTAHGIPISACITQPSLKNNQLSWQTAPTTSLDDEVIRSHQNPFSPEGGLKLLQGNLGQSIVKSSAVDPSHWHITAPAFIWDCPNAFLSDAQNHNLPDGDFIVVIRFQGPKANGMPELHKLIPTLSVLQQEGRNTALLTDGRLSGASGSVLAAIHQSPEALDGGVLSLLRNGDIITLDINGGIMSSAANFSARTPAQAPASSAGCGRELFDQLRHHVSPSHEGAALWEIT